MSSQNNQNTQLTIANNYDAKKQIFFSDPVSGEIPDSKPKIEFKRIYISTRNQDGTTGELIIPTCKDLYSFGISENKSQETGKITGYTLPICLYNRNGPTEEQKQWVEKFDEIINVIIDHIVENREEIDMFDLTRSDLTKVKGGVNPLYWKREKVINEKTKKAELKIVPGTGPTLYSKLIFSKKHDKFLSQFFDKDDNHIDPFEMMGKHCRVQGAIKFESIFIGSKISIQVKLHEAVVEMVQQGNRRLLSRPAMKSQVLSISNSDNSNPNNLINEADDSDSDCGSIADDSDKEEPKKVVKKTVRKVVKKTK